MDNYFLMLISVILEEQEDEMVGSCKADISSLLSDFYYNTHYTQVCYMEESTPDR